MADRFMGHRHRPEPPVFDKVSERDIVTLADALCRSLEYHSMLVASKVMNEIGVRGLWPAVVDRRAHSIRLASPDIPDDAAHRLAVEQIDHFCDEHFPVEPAHTDDSHPGEAGRWNGYIAF